MSPANALNFDLSKNLLSGKELNVQQAIGYLFINFSLLIVEMSLFMGCIQIEA